LARNITPETLFFAIGSNLGADGLSALQTVIASFAAIAGVFGPLHRKSSVYLTPCFPAGAGPDFANAVVSVVSGTPPDKVLAQLHAIEAHFGRKRAARWDARTLDIDLLAAGQKVLPDLDTFRHWQQLDLEIQKQTAPSQLILPHPRLQDRGFVLVPFAQIAPDWRHPELGKTAAEMRDALPQAELAQIKEIS